MATTSCHRPGYGRDIRSRSFDLTPISGLDRPYRWPQGIFAASAGIFALCVLVQIFIAGDAALLAPHMWAKHVTWAFRCRSQLIGRAAAYGSRSRIPMVIIGLQYYRIPTAIRHGDSALVRLYATVGAVPFGIMVFILQDWRYRTPTTEVR